MTHSPDKAMQIEANAVRRANPSIRCYDWTVPQKEGRWMAKILNDINAFGTGSTEAAAILDLAEKLGLEKDYE